MMTATRSLWCLFAFVLLPQGLSGQTLQGRVFDAVNDRSVSTAVVRLVDASGAVRAAGTADAAGRYRISIRALGVYRLQAEGLGYELYESEPLEVQTAAGVLTIDIPMRPSPVPIQGVEVSTDEQNRRLRAFLGMSPVLLRIRPIRPATVRSHALRGEGLSALVAAAQIPSLQILRTRDGPCFQFRGRGCMPVYLDGATLNRIPDAMVPLDMVSTVVILLPNESVAYPSGAVHLFTIGFMR